METTLETATAEEFRVWVSTFGLYNNGYLIGYWVDAIDAPETVEEFLTGLQERGQTLPANVAAIVGDELHCFDTEYAPIRGEMSARDARELAAAMEDIEEENMLAFLAVCRDQHAATVADIERIAASFQDNFRGYWDALSDYWENYFEEEGLFRNMPEELTYYFDFESYARDSDATLMIDAAGGTFVYFCY